MPHQYAVWMMMLERGANTHLFGHVPYKTLSISLFKFCSIHGDEQSINDNQIVLSYVQYNAIDTVAWVSTQIRKMTVEIA